METVPYQRPIQGGHPANVVSPTPRSPPPLLCSPQEWQYEMRREAQEIVPGLLLGAYNTATNADRLVEAGITHLLCVRDAREISLVRPRFPNQFVYYTLEVKDSDDEKIIGRIPACLNFIDDAIASGGRVLAHCATGIALAPAIVVSYLMTKYVWDFDSALSYVQTKRYCVSPLNFKNQLQEYEPIYKAMQTIQQSGVSGGDWIANGRSKRVLEDDDDDDELDNRRSSMPHWSGARLQTEDEQMT